MASPFAVHAGSLQQRVSTPFAGETGHAFELGHGGHLDVNLAVGDRHDLSQSFVLGAGARVIRMRVRIEAAPITVPWEFAVLFNAGVQYAREIRIAKRVLMLEDIVVRLIGALAPPASNVLVLRLRRAG